LGKRVKKKMMRHVASIVKRRGVYRVVVGRAGGE
jgi:hypothetical protein